jgi:hypothetical protein
MSDHLVQICRGQILTLDKCEAYRQNWRKYPLLSNDPPKFLTGPGTELKKILIDLGITSNNTCGCDAFVTKMNHWGVDGCIAHRIEILNHLSEQYKEATFSTKIQAAIYSLRGYPKTLTGLLDLAIENSRNSE